MGVSGNVEHGYGSTTYEDRGLIDLDVENRFLKKKGKSKKGKKNHSTVYVYHGREYWYQYHEGKGKGKGKKRGGGKKGKKRNNYHGRHSGGRRPSRWSGWYYMDDTVYSFDGFDDHNNEPKPTPVPPSPTPNNNLPGGTIGCLSSDSSSNSGSNFDGSFEKKTIKYEYSLKTLDGYDEEKAVENIEKAFFELMVDFLGCDEKGKTSRRRALFTGDGRSNNSSRELTVIGIHPDPDDKVSANDNVQGGVTIYTDGKDSNDEICELIKKIKDMASKLNSGQVEGVDSIDLKSISADGVDCSRLTPVSAVETVETSNNDGVLHGTLWPLLLIVLLIACAFFFIHRRRQRFLGDMNDIEDRVTTYIDDMRPDPVNTIDVHSCNSASCISCAEGKEQTIFIKTKGPSWLKHEETTMLEPINEEDCLPISNTHLESHSDTDQPLDEI